MLPDLNKTAFMVIPMLDITYEDLNDALVDAFLLKRGEEILLVIVLDRKHADYKADCRLFMSLPYFLEKKLMRSNRAHTAIVLRIADKWKEDLQLFVKGRYSSMSKAYKDWVTSFLKREHPLRKVLYPTRGDKDLLASELEVPRRILPKDIMSIPTEEEYLQEEDLLDAPITNGDFRLV